MLTKVTHLEMSSFSLLKTQTCLLKTNWGAYVPFIDIYRI